MGSTQGAFKNRYYNHRSSFAHKIFSYRTSLYDYVLEIKKKQSYIKMEDSKKNVVNISLVIDIANQRSEILNGCRHKSLVT